MTFEWIWVKILFDLKLIYSVQDGRSSLLYNLPTLTNVTCTELNFGVVVAESHFKLNLSANGSHKISTNCMRLSLFIKSLSRFDHEWLQIHYFKNSTSLVFIFKCPSELDTLFSNNTQR